MFEVQKYLLSGKTHADLNQEFGIIVNPHPELPLVILNYNQLESPKTHPLVRDCRGLVLHSLTHDLAARSFSRFFNWGEHQEEMKEFDFSDFHAHTKEDGSLVLIYNFENRWFAATRNSFGNLQIKDCEYSWAEVILKALQLGDLEELSSFLNPKYCYICELCSPWTKVIRKYDKPELYLLTVFDGYQELPVSIVDEIYSSTKYLFSRPHRYSFTSIEEIKEFLESQAKGDPTFEGVVICDKKFQRHKIKNPKYLSLHFLYGNGNIFLPKYLLPFVLDGDRDELLTYFPEAEKRYNAVEGKVTIAYNELLEIWKQTWQIENQKEFALSIIGKTKFTGILFNMRKQYGKEQTEKLLNKMWRESKETILNNLDFN